jgi:hypothetical protein
MAIVFWNSRGVLFIDFLTEKWTINAAHYSKLLKNGETPAFRSKRRDRSVKIVCLLHHNARPHIAVVTTGTPKEINLKLLPQPAYSPVLVTSDFHLFGPLRDTHGR